MDAERKAKEMAVLVADLQRMRSETARNAVSEMMLTIVILMRQNGCSYTTTSKNDDGGLAGGGGEDDEVPGGDAHQGDGAAPGDSKLHYPNKLCCLQL